MKKTKIKFYLAIIFLLFSVVIASFYAKEIDKFEKILIPFFFIYFVIDAITVLFPVFNTSVQSGKLLNKFYIQTNNYEPHTLSALVKQQNMRSMIIFLVYFSFITSVGFLYLYWDPFTTLYLYVFFFAINLSDYICILIWCPFKSIFLKNTCCNRCRITNWDRLMKFYILVFIPSIYSFILVGLGLIIFMVWEYNHYKHPERFYSISNKTLMCKTCSSVSNCKKKKE